MDRINEFASEKTKFRRTLFGTRNNIFTVCIASADNPMGVKYAEKANMVMRKQVTLLQILILLYVNSFLGLKSLIKNPLFLES